MRLPNQKKWLTEKFEIFKEHHDRKTLTQFFPTVYKEYLALWPPIPTEKDIDTAKDKMEVAVAIARKNEEKVSDFDFRMISVLIAMVISEFIDGCTTELDRSTVRTDRVRLPV